MEAEELHIQGASFFFPQTPETRWSKDGAAILAHEVSQSPVGSSPNPNEFKPPNHDSSGWPLTEKYYSSLEWPPGHAHEAL